jgi:drug/metabolite transporter (DMT)-like permease
MTRPSPARVTLLVACAMCAFAANSLLCRMALKNTAIDAASFTTIRIVSGALVLGLIVIARRFPGPWFGLRGAWKSAAALFAYAAAFSYAYIELPTAVGALLLFGAVQVTMIGIGFASGERFRPVQWLGFALAIGGLVSLLLPGLSAPSVGSAALMIVAGIAWGLYSLFGRRLGNPTASTAGNFVLAVPFTVVLSLFALGDARLDATGVGYAIASGAIASGLGYAIWYAALPLIAATSAATIQLSVPVVAAIGGIVFLGESLSLRLVVCSVAILGGIGLVIGGRRMVATAPLPGNGR